MEYRTCKACGEIKEASKGVWVTKQGVAEGRLCLVCNTKNNNAKRALPENKAKHSAARLSACTGVAYTVDHVIPLQGRLVSGLHVHNNLQIITKPENSAKGNKWEVY